MTDSVVVWEAPVIVKPEFRLYYDDKGHVLFYTCEKPDGKFIVVDSSTFAQGRPDVRVIDGRISTAPRGLIVSKLVPGDPGIACAADDISIVVDDIFTEKTTNWKLTTYEL